MATDLRQFPTSVIHCKFRRRPIFVYQIENYEFVYDPKERILLAFEVVFDEDKADFVTKKDIQSTMFHNEAVAWLRHEMGFTYLVDHNCLQFDLDAN